jgi:pimeloyl-ACP methyl ester carboxylesterase
MSPAAAKPDFEVDVRDILELAGDSPTGSEQAGAHLVGLAYGGMLAMLAAARRPERVLSLTLIEPPALGIARGHAAVERLLARMAPLYERELAPESFIAEYARALGQEIDEPVQLSPRHRRAIQATMDEPPPWQAEIPFDTLEQAAFPKLILSGDWHPALETVADVLARRIGAERAVIQGAGHDLPSSGKPLNKRLEAIVSGAVIERAA